MHSFTSLIRSGESTTSHSITGPPKNLKNTNEIIRVGEAIERGENWKEEYWILSKEKLQVVREINVAGEQGDAQRGGVDVDSCYHHR
ncbi:hypothetical protein L1887_12084 [Cichorium endivia]|nr:hypothetical protein L1887_12084 [Cichorium endivia]